MYYDYKWSNSNFKANVVQYRIFIYYIIFVIMKRLHLLLNPLAFQFIS